MSNTKFSYLALGDSYTIGEGVPLYQSFPYQVVNMLRTRRFNFCAPEIIACTGWTTLELANQLLETPLASPYDFVTLLIGVNNQYRNLPVKEYRKDFDFLLKKAIENAGGKAGNLVVLSIPDWGVTPFAKGKDIEKIAKEIDAFNVINKTLTVDYKAQYIDVTTASRDLMWQSNFVVEDDLHPSAEVYADWAKLVVATIVRLIEEGE